MSGPVLQAAPTPAPDARERSRAAFLASPGWISAIVGAIVGSALCFFVLAPWQFNRNAERSAENARIIATATADPVPLAEVLPAGGQATDQQAFRPVTVTGTFLADRQVAVGLRQNQASQPSVEILTPLQLSDGSVLLVDRGYLSANTYNGSIPLPPPPAGLVTVTARIQPYQPDPLQRPAIQRDGYLEVRGIEATSVPGLSDVRGGFVQLTENSPGVLGAIGVPQVDSGPFLSYAWQWITFGTMALLALGFFIYREVVDPRDDPRDDPAEDPRTATPGRPETAGSGAGPAADAPSGDRHDGDDGDDGDDSANPTGPPLVKPQRSSRSARTPRFDRSQLYDS
ncbi:MAG: SURF1 family cytochrome oxidase biogenesis protein [Nakamurella sp.]